MNDGLQTGTVQQGEPIDFDCLSVHLVAVFEYVDVVSPQHCESIRNRDSRIGITFGCNKSDQVVCYLFDWYLVTFTRFR